MIYRRSQTKYVNIIGTYRIQNKIVLKSITVIFNSHIITNSFKNGGSQFVCGNCDNSRTVGA